MKLKQRQFHLSQSNLPLLIQILQDLLKQGHYPTITIKESDASDEQRKRLWGYLYKSIGLHLGYTAQEIHLLCAHQFLRETKVVNGQEITYTKSTTDLTVKEMIDYQTQIEAWASITLGWHGDV